MKKLWLVKNHYGYFDTHIEGYIEANTKTEAMTILKKRAEKFGKNANIIASVEEIKPIDMTKGPY